MSPVIRSLHIYPIKSCQGISYDQVELTRTGFKYDRHWMLVDKQGQFLTQRQQPAMAKIKTSITPDSLLVSYEKSNTLKIPLQGMSDEQKKVQIWNDQCLANLVSTQASEWFSEILELPCDLVALVETKPRLVDPDYARSKQQVGFADGFPLLVLSQASITQLSEKLGEDVNINRFRANIIIDGCDAHAEDQWASIHINNITIDLVKPCSRCVIPSIDQQTAEKHPTLLRTLASYRRRDGKVFAGQNGLHQSNGELSVGQAVIVTEK